MVLERLSEGLRDAFSKITRAGYVDKVEVENILKDIQKVLIQADVDVELVLEFSNKVRERVLKEGKAKNLLTTREMLIKTLYDELVDMLGREKYEVKVGKQRILVIGLFGSGKTTTCGKLAKYFMERNLKVGLVACDTHRPAAKEQLVQIGKKLSVPVYTEGNAPKEIARKALSASKEDVLIFDSAGRNALDEELAKELRELESAIRPEEVLLVIPADLGQQARVQAEGFSKLVGISGVVVTKLDSTAKGGAALVACRYASAPVKFIGTGEGLDKIEEYDPVRFVSRMLGYGDLQGLLEKAKKSGIKEETVKHIASGRFDLNDFYEQIEAMRGMGPLSKVVEMVPGMGNLMRKIPSSALDVQEEKMKKWKYMMDSMTKEEKSNPEIIDNSRIRRIAKGSGTREEEVRELLKMYKKMKKLVKMASPKSLKRGGLMKVFRQFGMGF